MTTTNTNADGSTSNTSNSNAITRSLIAEASRMDATHTLFGLHFPLRVEPTVFHMAGMLSEQYQGGNWEFYALSNGGFYMAPSSNPHGQNPDKSFAVSCDNGSTSRSDGTPCRRCDWWATASTPGLPVTAIAFMNIVTWDYI